MKTLLISIAILAATLPQTHATEGNRQKPNLFIGGGGALGSARQEFFNMIGKDARLIVIPNGGDEETFKKQIKRWNDWGFEKVIVLHTSDREEAFTQNFAGKIQFADAVWFTGGYQQEFARVYAGTPVERELINLLNRGGAIGGSSAGASIQTKTMICGGETRPQILSGLDLLPGAIIDQHFLARNRLPRLSYAVRENPALVGYGIDEGTALVVSGGKMKVVGKSYVIRIKIVKGKLQVDAFKPGDELPMPKSQD